MPYFFQLIFKSNCGSYNSSVSLHLMISVDSQQMEFRMKYSNTFDVRHATVYLLIHILKKYRSREVSLSTVLLPDLLQPSEFIDN